MPGVKLFCLLGVSLSSVVVDTDNIGRLVGLVRLFVVRRVGFVILLVVILEVVVGLKVVVVVGLLVVVVVLFVVLLVVVRLVVLRVVLVVLDGLLVLLLTAESFFAKELPPGTKIEIT